MLRSYPQAHSIDEIVFELSKFLKRIPAESLHARKIADTIKRLENLRERALADDRVLNQTSQ
jgi:hypothetical protein